ncbi:MAG TPA: hypothetical protein VGB85_17595 [Nannocystis sp.]
MRPLFRIFTAALLAACNPDDKAMTSETSGTSGGVASDTPTTSGGTTGALTTTSSGDSTGDTTGADATCMCAAFSEIEGGCANDSVWMHVAQCELDTICPPLTVQCPRPGADLYDCQGELVFAEDAMTCALAALRDRTPGRFIVEGTEAGMFYFGTLYGLRLRGDEVAVVTECRSGEGTGWHASDRPLAPPAHFAGCLAMPKPLARHGCLLQGLGDPVVLPECAGE